ncbi:MAG: hypothetical protein ACTSQH_03505, partial [Candidatus Hodarchaeales archaeon]
AAWDGQLWEEGFAVTLVYGAGNEGDRISSEILKAGVEAINPLFKILLTPVDNAVADAITWTAQSPLTQSGDWINYPDPHIAYEQQISSYSLFQRAGRYNNERVDELISLAYEETDESVREAMYLEIADYLYSDVPHIYRETKGLRHKTNPSHNPNILRNNDNSLHSHKIHRRPSKYLHIPGYDTGSSRMG